MHFSFPQKVLFKHCDPAGIVFYPRFFEMINDAVEAMFSEILDWPFETIHPEQGVPTAEFKVRFKASCLHGDQLVLDVEMKRLGRSSLSLATTARRDEQICFEADQILVCVDRNGRPVSWPDDVRAKINSLMETAT